MWPGAVAKTEVGAMSFFDYPTEGRPEPEQEEYFLSTCSDDDWATILGHATTRRFGAGQTVVGPAEADRALYIVTEGTLEAVIAQGRRGKFRRIRTFGPGNVIGELSFFDGQPRSAQVRALTDAELA